MIPVKNDSELELLRKSGKILAAVMREISGTVAAGITTAELDRLAEELVVSYGGKPAFKGYKGFPATLCVSIDEEIVHGIPGPRVITDGSIVSIDLGVDFQGYFSDAAITLAVGKVDPRKNKLIETAQTALFEGIKLARAGNHLFDISQRIQDYAEKNGFSVVRQFVGHGIGCALHEEPEIPNFGKAGVGPVLKNGMVLAIEPMVNMGGWEAQIAENGWTAVTKDGLPSAHFEHTVAITPKGPEILTN